MSPSSFPQMAAAIFVTTVATMLPTATPEPQAAFPRVAEAPATLQPAGVTPVARQAQLDPDTPGCAEAGLTGLMRRNRQVSYDFERDFLPKPQRVAPGMANPLGMAQGTRTAMHRCVVDHFNPADPVGVRGILYRT